MWSTAVTESIAFFVKGFLGADLDVDLLATINDLVGVAPGSYAITSTNNGVSGQITSMSVANCVVSASSVDVTVNGNPFTSAETKVEDKINDQGGNLCTKINQKLTAGVVGKSIPL